MVRGNQWLFPLREGGPPSSGKINTIRHLFKGTFYAEVGHIPLHWELWRAGITSFLLYELTPFQKWMGLGASLEASYIFTPLELAVLTYIESLALDNLHNSKGNIVLLWQSALWWRGKYPTGPTVAKNPRQVDIQNMTRQHRVGSIP